nr:MAG TPA: hypothetical protein [Caudoviricetes sp.]
MRTGTTGQRKARLRQGTNAHLTSNVHSWR